MRRDFDARFFCTGGLHRGARKRLFLAKSGLYSCLQHLGGYGYMEEYPLARMSRDSRLGPIGGGTSEILKDVIAKMILDGKTYKKSGRFK